MDQNGHGFQSSVSIDSKSRFSPAAPGVPSANWRCDHCGADIGVADIAVNVMTQDSYDRLKDCKPGDRITIEFER